LKDIRKKVNKKINDNYNKRQKILTEIKKSLNIDFGKISNYRDEIIISTQSLHNTINNNFENSNDNRNNILNKSSLTRDDNDDPSYDYHNQRKSSLFRINIPNSILGFPQFYYKNKEINYLTISELVNLQKDMDYILEEVEKEINKTLD
jgi:hypothetical protein